MAGFAAATLLSVRGSKTFNGAWCYSRYCAMQVCTDRLAVVVSWLIVTSRIAYSLSVISVEASLKYGAGTAGNSGGHTLRARQPECTGA